MCLYPIYIRNKRYTPNSKNGGFAPICDDNRKLYVPVGCGVCIECRRKRANEWKVRLNEEIAHNREKALFVTLTFSDEEYTRLYNESEAKTDEQMLTYTIRRFKDRVRKRFSTAKRMWLIQEYGSDYDRVHIHGLIWGMNDEEIKQTWKHGFTFCGKTIGPQTVNYIVKYCLKADKKRPNWKPKIWCSPGLGKDYNAKINQYAAEKTKEYYVCPNGAKINLPIYYRNKIYTDEQRENLWIQRLNKNERYAMKSRYKLITQEDIEDFKRILKNYQEINEQNGYGFVPNYWKSKNKNHGNLNIWNCQKKEVVLQINSNQFSYGTSKTYGGNNSQNEHVELGHEETEIRNTLHTARGLFHTKNICDGQITHGRLWNAPERHRNFNRQYPTREVANYMDRTQSTNSHNIENWIIKESKAFPDSNLKMGNMDNIERSTYECIDVDTGEIYNKLDKSKTFKTICYERTSRKITKPDGTKTKIWKTIRFVQECGKEQYKFDFG